MTSRPRRPLRILRWIGVAVATVIVVWIAMLAFPQMLCPHHVRAGAVSLYYEGLEPPEATALARATHERLAGCRYYDSTETMRVFLFGSPGKYAIFTRLAGIPRDAQGFNLSLLGNTFVSAPRVAELGRRSGGGPKYSVWEGDLSHTIAHEVAHQLIVDRLGRRALPQWKREGLAEYVANIGLTRNDPAASLISRLAVFHDHRAWSATAGWERHGWDRIHYESGLLAEYLIEVGGYTPEHIAADSVTIDDARTALQRWAEAQYAPRPAP